MPASVISVRSDEVTLKVTIKLSGSMLELEDNILASLNEAGDLATGVALERFDADGDPIMFGGEKWTSKGRLPKTYQTPYGKVEVNRHVYQRSAGGATYCPMEHNARIVIRATPRFAKIVSHKMANAASPVVQQDMAENHGRQCARSYLQNLADAVGSVAQAKEETWHYETPKLEKPVSHVAVGLDGTCMLYCEEGYREAMTGTISLYDRDGERQHTIYIGAAPEYGKETFYERMEREIAHVKRLYPDATYVGIADGAKCNWEFLSQYNAVQILDFYHAAEYVNKVSFAVCPRNEGEREEWVASRCHALKHEHGAAQRLLKELNELPPTRLNETVREDLENTITYFENHQHQMYYANYRKKGYPIGSGVTEAACKTLVKQRLCCSGMKWVERGARVILSLRTLVLTDQRWQQFWSKINQYGFAMPAST